MSAITALGVGQAVNIMDAKATSGAGATFAVPRRPLGTPGSFLWTVASAPGSASNTVNLEGSLDNSVWFVIDQILVIGGAISSVVNNPVNFIRANISVLGSNEVVTVLVTF